MMTGRVKMHRNQNVKTAGIGLIVLACLSMAVPSFAQSAFDDPGARPQAGVRGGGIADLVPVQNNVDAGTISVGATAQVVVLFRNDSGRALETGAINLYPSSTVSATVALNECSSEPLPPGATCAIGLSVQGLQTGRWRVEMLMRHSGQTRLVTATMQGNVELSSEADRNTFKSDIEAIPRELDFEDLKTSQPAVMPVVLRNITSNPIDVKAIYVEAAEQAGFTFRTDCEKLAPGQACIVTMIWSPVLKGQATGVLVVEHTGPTSVASVPLMGEFNPDQVNTARVFPEAVPGKGLLVSSQDKIDFGTTISTTSSITVSLVNVGDAAVRVSDVRLAGGDNGLSISQSGCKPGLVLAPVEACPLTLSWSPVREGPVLDDVQIVHDGARGVLVLPVRGSATSIVSQDNKAVRLAGDGDGSFGMDSPIATQVANRERNVDPASVLDGFVITSHSSNRAIITGPGGSRIVFNGEEIVIGGFVWEVNIRSSGIEFRGNGQSVLLLFDRALSSGGGRASSTRTTPTAAAPATGN
jgi:hypothetical protein